MTTPADPPATDAAEMAKLLRMYYQASLPEPNVFDDDVLRAADLIERQAREIADKRAMLQNTNRDAARLAHLADKYKWQVRDTCTRAERAEAERDALRECIEWALGEGEDFPAWPDTVTITGNPKYWWRTELLRRYDAARAKVRT